ncbi:hypothetical protein [Gordonia polyisoprenivorans]|uniref:hypothetical protein n=1 Tax=Gordonia polyisoprenivorans TaxID=84595 RepID=UPI0013FDD973|nr:hypothetical protein [Gordonia polyisoprenivorans]
MSDRPDPDRSPEAYRRWAAERDQDARLARQDRRYSFSQYAPPPGESDYPATR